MQFSMRNRQNDHKKSPNDDYKKQRLGQFSARIAKSDEYTKLARLFPVCMRRLRCFRWRPHPQNKPKGHCRIFLLYELRVLPARRFRRCGPMNGRSSRASAASKPLAPGKSTVKFDFAYDGGGPGKGGTGTLSVNGEKVAEGRLERTQAGLFSADETADVGIDLGTPVVEAVGAEAGSKFNGHIPKLGVEVRAAQPNAQAAVKQAQ